MSPYRSAQTTRQPFKRSLYGRLRRAYRKWWFSSWERDIERTIARRGWEFKR